MTEDIGFDLQFHFVRELVAIVAEDLDAVVLPGIVGGGDDDAGGKIAGAGEVGDAGRGDDAGGFGLHAAGGEASGNGLRDPVGGLTRVLPKEHASRAVLAGEIVAERGAYAERGALIERVSAGDPADAVRAEQFSHMD